MSTCDQLTESATFGAAPALRAVDCLANEAAGAAFGRLFGSGGALMPALTIILTLYIAFFAVSLLTGRSRIGISALTPRMMTLGLVLTFATSWVAYQGVFWNLAIGTPDQLAGILTGAKGSATGIFADKLDIIFAAISQASDAVSGGAQAAAGEAGKAAQAAQGGSFTPSNLMWMGALLLLLGTVGVLVTARIALAVLLAVGPIFVVFALFSGTRGLCAGWLRGVVMTAVTPLFVVVGGSLMLELAVPVLARLVGEGQINGQAAMGLFLIAAVHAALMAMILKVTATMVSAWGVFGLDAKAESGSAQTVAAPLPVSAYGAEAASASQAAAAPRRAAALVAPTAATAPAAEAAPGSSASSHRSRTVITQVQSGGTAAPSHLPALRGRGVGSRFRPRPSQPRELMR